MPLTLNDAQIKRLVGQQAFARGQRYSENGQVVQKLWTESGTHLVGNVRGTRRSPYAVTVSFTMDAARNAVQAVGRCTCPMQTNCKHVAALLVEDQYDSADFDYDEDQDDIDGWLDDDGWWRHDATFPAEPTPRRPPPEPAWQTALKPLARTNSSSSTSTGTPLALQFSVVFPAAASNSFTGITNADTRLSLNSTRLFVRPMVIGKKGKWIRGRVTWDNVAYVDSSVNRTHRTVLASLYELFPAAQRYSSHLGLGMQLDTFGNRAFWHLLEQARDAGIALIVDNPAQDPVLLTMSRAELTLDVRREPERLTLAPTLTLDEHVLDLATVGFVGSPAHGIFSWGVGAEYSEPSLSIKAVSSGKPARSGKQVPTAKPTNASVVKQLTLAPLASVLDPQLSTLAANAGTISIPSVDEQLFLTDYFPYLRDQIAVTSSDSSVQLPERPRPFLALKIAHKTSAQINLHWEWHYVTPDAAATKDTHEPSVAHRPLRRPTDDPAYRDDAREAQILHALNGILTRFPLLVATATQLAYQPSAAILAENSVLGGSTMIEFLTTAVPELETSDELIVTVVGNTPDYREAEEPPAITLATTERVDDRDWFDLAVTVTVDDEEIAFDELFLALARGDELMILSTGVWFSLDRPELHQLRRLIEEARGLQDAQSRGLKLSRYQTDLWDELQELGLVSQQATAWREAIAGLTDAGGIEKRPLPETVNAKLRGYQHTGFDWLTFLHENQLGGVLADDMGLGKTLQVISLIAHVRQTTADSASADSASMPAPFLVVAPTSVVSNWAAECAKFAPGLRMSSITATSAKRGIGLAEFAAESDVVITSYALFRLDFDEYEGLEWSGLLLDEAQFVKNHQSRAYQCARRLSAPFKLAITGTPLENNLMELWSLLSITAPGLFPSPSRFADFYQKPIEKEGNSERLATLRRRIRPFMLRRTKEEVASDLPAKQEQVLELELHPKHRKVYQTHLQRERQKVLGLIDDMNANRFEIFRSLTMLRQLSLDASLYDKKYADVPSTKLDALLELLEDVVTEGHRTLIFSQFTGYLAKARARLDAAGISYSYLDGKTRNRAKTIDDFKSGSTSVFLISLKAGGFGLNLTEADYCILLDPWWNPATEAQAVDRAHRIGQTKKVMVYRLVAKDTIEEKVMALKATKARLFDSVMTDGGASGSALTASDIRELLA